MKTIKSKIVIWYPNIFIDNLNNLNNAMNEQCNE